MKKAAECTTISEIREAIDDIDMKLVELIAERSVFVREAARFKKDETSVRDKDRVQEVIESKMQLADTFGVSRDLIGKIYRLMIDFFITEELHEWKRKGEKDAGR